MSKNLTWSRIVSELLSPHYVPVHVLVPCVLQNGLLSWRSLHFLWWQEVMWHCAAWTDVVQLSRLTSSSLADILPRLKLHLTESLLSGMSNSLMKVTTGALLIGPHHHRASWVSEVMKQGSRFYELKVRSVSEVCKRYVLEFPNIVEANKCSHRDLICSKKTASCICMISWVYPLHLTYHTQQLTDKSVFAPVVWLNNLST